MKSKRRLTQLEQSASAKIFPISAANIHQIVDSSFTTLRRAGFWSVVASTSMSQVVMLILMPLTAAQRRLELKISPEVASQLKVSLPFHFMVKSFPLNTLVLHS